MEDRIDSGTPDETERLFVYGTLQPGGPNEGVLAEIEGRWMRGTVRGWLRPTGWGASLGYPAVTLDPGGERVRGHVFESDRLGAHWSRLDRFEGDEYERVRTEVRLEDGGWVDAWIYVATDR